MCPKCNIETEFLGVNSLVTPFWQNLPHFFTYPLSKDGLLVIGGYGLGFGLLGLLDKAGLHFFAFALSMVFLLLFFSLIGYCNFLFHHTMKGKLTPPGIDHPDYEFFTFDHIKQILIWLLLNAIGASFLLEVPVPFNLVLYETGKVILPAIFILLIVNNRLAFSLNPLRLAAFIQQLGLKNYLLLYLFTSFLLGASDTIQYLFYKLDIESSFIASVIGHSAQAYYLIILYHMLGYVVLQFHHKLGWEVNYANFLHSNNKEILESNKNIDPILNDARFLLGESKPEEALDLIRTETKGEFTSPDLALIFVKLVNQLGYRKQLRHVGGNIIELLLSHNKTKEAVDIYEQCSTEIPGFKVSTASLHNLTTQYLKAGNYKNAMKSGIEFIQRVPNDEKAPQMCLTLADISSNKLSDDKMALQLIKHFGKQYKGHDLMSKAKEMYLQLKPNKLSSKLQKSP